MEYYYEFGCTRVWNVVKIPIAAEFTQAKQASWERRCASRMTRSASRVPVGSSVIQVRYAGVARLAVGTVSRADIAVQPTVYRRSPRHRIPRRRVNQRTQRHSSFLTASTRRDVYRTSRVETAIGVCKDLGICNPRGSVAEYALIPCTCQSLSRERCRKPNLYMNNSALPPWYNSYHLIRRDLYYSGP